MGRSLLCTFLRELWLERRCEALAFFFFLRQSPRSVRLIYASRWQEETDPKDR